MISIKSVTLFWYYSKSLRTSKSWLTAPTPLWRSPLAPSTPIRLLVLCNRPWWLDQVRSSPSNSQIRPLSSTASQMWASIAEIRPRSSTLMASLPLQQPISSQPRSHLQPSPLVLRSSWIRLRKPRAIRSTRILRNLKVLTVTMIWSSRQRAHPRLPKRQITTLLSQISSNRDWWTTGGRSARTWFSRTSWSCGTHSFVLSSLMRFTRICAL